ncbi:MAG: hypothetical protein DRP57_13870, partial [Spirochaetes bacterium]
KAAYVPFAPNPSLCVEASPHEKRSFYGWREKSAVIIFILKFIFHILSESGYSLHNFFFQYVYLKQVHYGFSDYVNLHFQQPVVFR